MNKIYNRYKHYNYLLKILNVCLWVNAIQMTFFIITFLFFSKEYSAWNVAVPVITFWLIIAKEVCSLHMEVLKTEYKMYLIKYKERGIKRSKIRNFVFGILIVAMFLVSLFDMFQKQGLFLIVFQKEALSSNIFIVFSGILLAYIIFDAVCNWYAGKNNFVVHERMFTGLKGKMSNEYAYIASLIERTKDEDIKKYVAHELYHYAKRAKFNKRCYYIFSIISLIAPAIALVVNNSFEAEFFSKVCVSTLSAVATISTGVNGLVKFKETWIRYRSYCEILKRELTEYVSNLGEYSNEQLGEKDKKELFYKKMKENVQEEEKEWKTMRGKE